MAESASLADVPDRLLAELDTARRGVLVLAVDGLAHAVAAEHWRPSSLERLSSTVPSTSTTAWLTAVTGVGAAEHGVPGMVYRLPAEGTLVYAVTGRVLATGPADRKAPAGLLRPHPTVFQRAERRGVRCVALGRETETLDGPWAAAVLAGCERLVVTDPAKLADEAADPHRLVAGVALDVDAVLPTVLPDRPLLLWCYVNLDDYVHRHGYDEAVRAAMTELAGHAERWAADGWTVLAHADHGQVPCEPSAEVAAAWAAVDNPADCLLPAGGAGRIRWLYPKPGREAQVTANLRAALAGTGTVLHAAEVPEWGGATGLLAGRIGSVVAIADTPYFPLPDPTLRFEHGGRHPDEMDVPLAIWR